jgi:hypothetical protein
MVSEGTPVVMNDGFSGMGIWGFLIIALFLMGGFGGGFAGNGFANAIGYENLATSNEVQRGFDNQNSMANQREILGAVNDASARGIATTNQVYHDVVSYVGDKYNELQRDVAGLAVGQAGLLAKEQECCCSTLRAIDGVNYNNALNTASINAKTTEQTQKILDALSANKIETLQNKVNELSLAQALAGVVRYPMGTNYAVPSPCFGGCSCGM